MEFQPVRVEIVFHGGGAGFPLEFIYYKLTKTVRHIKTTFLMKMYSDIYVNIHKEQIYRDTLSRHERVSPGI